MKTHRLATDLVLVGGGHAHVGVIRMLAMQPVSGVRVTLINSSSETPYSGMLPGLMAGRYQWDDCHIDLARLCRWAGVRLIRARVQQIDLEAQRIHLIDGASGLPRHLDYDCLSLNPGATPDLSTPGAANRVVAVKPIAHFIQQFERRMLPRAQCADASVVVGAGVGAVEVVLAGQKRLPNHRWRLVVGSGGLLPSAPQRVQQQIQAVLAQRGIQVIQGPVVEVRDKQLILAHRAIDFDHCLWNTQAAAPTWLADSGLPTDADGFVLTQPDLSVPGYPNIFVAGDAAAIGRPKAGVFAVRAGPVLANNLRRYLSAQPTQPWTPQQQWLAILNLANDQAIAWRGQHVFQGRWVWKLKDWIDRRFMARFSTHLPSMRPEIAGQDQPLCMGCGSKAPAQALGAVDLTRDAVRFDVQQPQMVTVDTLTDPLGDPWWLGRLAAMHAAGDLIAAGSRPQAYATSSAVNDNQPRLIGRDLAMMTQGVATVELGESLGGHSWNNHPANVTLTLLGPAQPSEPAELQPGMRVWISRPQGSGLLLAGAMADRVRGRFIDAWLDHAYPLEYDLMDLPPPVRLTDITGFGLAGHLVGLLEGHGIRWTQTIPHWPGIDWQSQAVLASANHELAHKILADLPSQQQQLVCDPQTLGGLLAIWPAQVTPPAPWVEIAVLDSPLV